MNFFRCDLKDYVYKRRVAEKYLWLKGKASEEKLLRDYQASVAKH